MGPLLVLILANTFLVELENTLVPRIHQNVKKQRRYVDDTFTYVKIESIDYLLMILNSFQTNISLAIFRCYFIRKGTRLITRVTKKDTHSNVYFHWDVFAYVSSKR